MTNFRTCASLSLSALLFAFVGCMPLASSGSDNGAPAPSNDNSSSGGGGGFATEPVGIPGTPDRQAGSAFFIEVAGELYAVTAQHLEDAIGGLPTRIYAGGVRIGLGEALPADNDVRIIRVTTGRATTLPLSGDTVRDGDPLFLLSPYGEIQGQFEGPAFRGGTRTSEVLSFVPAAPFAANGFSGSAVVIPGTGEVIGMVVAADVEGSATRLAFVPVIPPGA